MTNVACRLRRNVNGLADELCELYSQQFEAIQENPAAVKWEDYKERRTRIQQLQTELRGKVSQSS